MSYTDEGLKGWSFTIEMKEDQLYKTLDDTNVLMTQDSSESFSLKTLLVKLLDSSENFWQKESFSGRVPVIHFRKMSNQEIPSR